MTPHTKHRARKWALLALRWGVAIAGLSYVLAHISLPDRVLVLDPHNGRPGWPVERTLVGFGNDADQSFSVADPASGRTIDFPRSQLLRRPDRKSVTILAADGKPRQAQLLAIRQIAPAQSADHFDLLILPPNTRRPAWIESTQVVGGYRQRVLYPLVDIGLRHMLHEARPLLLALSLAVFPIATLLASLRWQALLAGLSIHLGFPRTLVLNLIGMFYNTFLPGSVGGDVFKAYYASRHTPHRTRAVISVLVDRVMGMLGLIVLGGFMAACQWWQAPPGTALAFACRAVTIGAAAFLAATTAGCLVFYHPALRRLSRLDWILSRLPMQKQVGNAVLAMEDYGQKPRLIFWALAVSIPVHIVVVLSALFAGHAFGLPLGGGFYFVAVPVIVLSGIIPLAPQGVGIMELLAILLTAREGCTVGQAFALTLSIRLVPIFWSLGGGFFALAPSYREKTQRLPQQPQKAMPGQEAGAWGS